MAATDSSRGALVSQEDRPPVGGGALAECRARREQPQQHEPRRDDAPTLCGGRVGRGAADVGKVPGRDQRRDEHGDCGKGEVCSNGQSDRSRERPEAGPDQPADAEGPVEAGHQRPVHGDLDVVGGGVHRHVPCAVGETDKEEDGTEHDDVWREAGDDEHRRARHHRSRQHPAEAEPIAQPARQRHRHDRRSGDGKQGRTEFGLAGAEV